MRSRFAEFVFRLPMSWWGSALDRSCVRLLGHSPVNWLGGRLTGGPYHRPLLLTTVGARSGRRRSVVLPFYSAGGDDLAVIGSNGGAPRDPHWVYNLRAHPDAEIHVARRKLRVRARICSGDERSRLWEQAVGQAPVYEEYQRRAKTQREIPVIVLSR